MASGELQEGFMDLGKSFVAHSLGSRRIPVSNFVREIGRTGAVHPDIRHRWVRPVLIRRTYQ